MIYLTQKNGVITLSGWNVDLLEFSDRWQVFWYNSSNKRRRTYAKALQSLVKSIPNGHVHCIDMHQ